MLCINSKVVKGNMMRFPPLICATRQVIPWDGCRGPVVGMYRGFVGQGGAGRMESGFIGVKLVRKEKEWLRQFPVFFLVMTLKKYDETLRYCSAGFCFLPEVFFLSLFLLLILILFHPLCFPPLLPPFPLSTTLVFTKCLCLGVCEICKYDKHLIYRPGNSSLFLGRASVQFLEPQTLLDNYHLDVLRRAA